MGQSVGTTVCVRRHECQSAELYMAWLSQCEFPAVQVYIYFFISSAPSCIQGIQRAGYASEKGLEDCVRHGDIVLDFGGGGPSVQVWKGEWRYFWSGTVSGGKERALAVSDKKSAADNCLSGAAGFPGLEEAE